MKTKILLINPWIYDFAALNLWSRPLGLLKVAECLSGYDADPGFIDCTDAVKTGRKFGTGKYQRQIIKKPDILKSVPRNYARYGMGIEEFKERVKGQLPVDAVFVTSLMTYWYQGVQQVIEIIKSVSPDTPVILGGIYATLYEKHASEHSGADVIYTGHIDKGVLFSEEGTPGRASFKNIERIMDDLGLRLTKAGRSRPYYELDLYGSYPFAPLLTGMGCPYTCPYCSTPLLFDRFVQRPPDQVLHEIKELHKMGVRDFAFYDDALLVNSDSYLKVVLKGVITSGMNIRFHCPNGIHARFIDDELAFLMKRSGFTTLRVSLETVNADRQAETGGKVTTDIFTSAIGNLKKHGFTREQIGVYIMYGLPGQELSEVEDGVTFLKGLDVKINLTEFSPIPGTSCWNELIERGTISTDIDPLLTNNSVFTRLFSGYDPHAFEKLLLSVNKNNSYA